MLLVYLILSFAMVFLAGCNWTLWKIDRNKNALYWSLFLGAFGMFHMIAMIGRAIQ